MDANADDEHDPEGSTVAFERAQVIALISEAESRLAAPGAGSGTAGHRSATPSAERCRCEIPLERLMARPATSICVDCCQNTTAGLRAPVD